MIWERLLAGDEARLGNGFRALIDRSMGEWRQNERRLAERRTIKHRLQARKSCVADARSYRVASHRFKRWLRAVGQ
jgi:hypothetical protein